MMADMSSGMVIGQYYPQDSLIHRLDPRVKLLGTVIFLISVFFVKNVLSFVIVTAFLAGTIALSKVPFRRYLRSMRAILVILVVSFVFTVLFTPGEILLKVGFIAITDAGLKTGFYMLMRLSYLVTGASMMTLTTTPNALTAGIEEGLGFLRRFGIPVHEWAMMMTIALRFIPILMDELDRIIKAQKSRGADFESGSLIRRAKALIPVIVPLFVSAIRKADDLAMAMEARCYHGGEGRTRMKPLKYTVSDITAYLVLAVYIVIVILTEYFIRLI